jgi:hypothetical protein
MKAFFSEAGSGRINQFSRRENNNSMKKTNELSAVLNTWLDGENSEHK